MSDIAPISRASVASLQAQMPVQRSAQQAETGTARPSDSVEFSEAAQYLAKIAELPEVRQDVVDRVKGEIAAGNYDTEDKIDAMLDALAEDL
ncbi:flagellar biosynthesis anti-sigma factor FlgM [Planctomycetota bacterium]|nr:flagellar biosynthesis anti-sigma factor FlgM [Planctomycetota bacterium]